MCAVMVSDAGRFDAPADTSLKRRRMTGIPRSFSATTATPSPSNSSSSATTPASASASPAPSVLRPQLGYGVRRHPVLFVSVSGEGAESARVAAT